jgi:deazaflavin-dependent oxidoreductase (nitroreductase family)
MGPDTLVTIRGRRSGKPRTVGLAVVELRGRRFVIGTYGDVHWVRNLRAAAGAGELRIGRKVEPFRAEELADADKPPVIHAYLDRFGWEVGRFFDGLSKSSSEEEIAAVAPGFPVFRLAAR